MQISIRAIQPEDYPAVLRLCSGELGNRHITETNLAETMEKMERDANYRTFVALSEQRVVGFITTVQVLALEYPVGYLKINGIAVERELQNKGIGTQILQYIENLAFTLGLSRIILCTGMQRKAAHAFYARNGYDCASYCITKKPQKETKT